MWRGAMASPPQPRARAASTKGISRKLRAALRTSRAKTGTLKTPIATIAFTPPGPASAVSNTALSRAGKANTRSALRINARSSAGGPSAASSPSGTPPASPSATARPASPTDWPSPTASIENTSRPNGSVPSQCSAEGAARRWAKSMRVGG